MTIAKIRRGNRITIPQDEMKRRNLAEGDEVYFEVHGKIGRDVFLGRSNTMIGSVVNASSTGTIWFNC